MIFDSLIILQCKAIPSSAMRSLVQQSRIMTFTILTSQKDVSKLENEAASSSGSIIRGGPHLILDINGCSISFKERPFSEIKKHLQSCLQNYEETRTILLKGMNKGAKKDHRYVLLFHNEEDEKAARIHTGQFARVCIFITHRTMVSHFG